MVQTRNTLQRREIIATLSRSPGFVSAQDLHAMIVDAGGRISLATVYAQLKRLAEDGELDVIMTDRGESLFRRCDVEVHHHHLACRNCGATIEVPTPDLDTFAREIATRHRYAEVRHVFELTGICPTCQTS